MFRTDINGLRAVAVLLVVTFHFYPSALPGGFIGVDMFFVISGYLMTRIILNKMEQERFSFLNFYGARVNRIVPALVCMCSILLVFGYFILLPVEFQTLSKHVVASVGFFSNYIYMSEVDYFDLGAKSKWLLHTWSLSVEWQFYIVYPAILWLLVKSGFGKAIKLGIVMLTIGSFAACVLMEDSNQAYFSLFSRVWQMLAGACVFLFPVALFAKYEKVTMALACLLIFVTCIWIDEHTTWPSSMSFLPVFAVYLVLQASPKQHVLLGHTWMQSIGKWSYSIYLWHWPLVVALFTFNLEGGWREVGLGLSLLLGFLSYHFVEQKCHAGKYDSVKTLLLCRPLLITYTVVGLGFFVWYQQGQMAFSSSRVADVTSKMHISPQRNACHVNAINRLTPQNACEYYGADVSWVGFGDSHAIEITHELAKALQSSGNGIKHLTYSGCVPSYMQNIEFSPCALWTNQAVESILTDDRLQNVLVAYRYSYSLFGHQLKDFPEVPVGEAEDDDFRQEILVSLRSAIMTLAKAKERVVVVLPIPELGRDISFYIRNAYLRSNDIGNIQGTDLEYYDKRNAMIMHFFTKNVWPDNVIFVDPRLSYCPDGDCWAVKDGLPLYFDDDHPSLAGASLIVDQVIRATAR